MPKVLVCVHMADDVKGEQIHKVYTSPDKLAYDHGLSWSEFEEHYSLFGREWYLQKGKYQIRVNEVDFDGILCHR